MGKSLLIVESPTKAKNLSKYLKDNYLVKASKGHIKDLPENRLGVDLENGFRAEYQIIEGKQKIVEDLRKSARSAERILLGPDPDREGEAISWHIAEEITRNGSKKNPPVYRVLFYELTQRGITEALNNPGKLNPHLYEAQQARRILDRLVGYLISPILWRKVRQGLSAGRVQSVALRLVCEREREIYAFRSEEYWTVEAVFSEGRVGKNLKARLVQCHGEKHCDLKTEVDVQRVIEVLKNRFYVVQDIKRKRQKKSPSPPFITSTLQQDASRRLKFSPQKTMQIAQQLYEGIEIPEVGPVGLITYMRTDSTRLSAEAVKAARQFIASYWGQEFVPAKPNQYKSKASSQDAHEAIRPTDVFRTPESLKPFLSRDQYLLYDLIWKRFVACQMKPSELERTTVDIVPEGLEGFLFRATGSVLLFSGYLVLYREITDDEDEDEEDVYLPAIEVGDGLELQEIKGSQHFTQPPRRYSEASLIKALEDFGIGRPSTYATIISTIQERGYVVSDKKNLKPTELGFVVNDLLVTHFPDIVDVSFTAQMEAQLDRISRGEGSMGELLKDFYERFRPMLDEAVKEMKNLRVEGIPTEVRCPDCEGELVIRWSKIGEPFVECPKCKFRSSYERDERGELRLISRNETEEICDKCGNPMLIKRSKYGTFLACSGYPKCKNTRAISLGVPCPREGCSGEIVERRSKRGRIFYGCSAFPKCSVIFNRKPYVRTCPQCGYKIMSREGKRNGAQSVWICLNKECKYREEADE
ncbi:MAG: type I DNA topoisomerase [Syntrophobacterales bacterium]|nr:type I DNA topoisomerase [Syntrophobacterales bacterium]